MFHSLWNVQLREWVDKNFGWSVDKSCCTFFDFDNLISFSNTSYSCKLFLCAAWSLAVSLPLPFWLEVVWRWYYLLMLFRVVHFVLFSQVTSRPYAWSMTCSKNALHITKEFLFCVFMLNRVEVLKSSYSLYPSHVPLKNIYFFFGFGRSHETN